MVINPNIHKDSKLSRTDFVRRLKKVEGIRTREGRANGAFYLSVYITSEEEFNAFRNMKLAVCEGDFSGIDDATGGLRTFGMWVPEHLYLWLRNCELPVIYKQITCWLTMLYAYSEGRSDKKGVMEDQIYTPVMEEVRRLYDKYYRADEQYASCSKIVDKTVEFWKSIDANKTPGDDPDPEGAFCRMHQRLIDRIYKESCLDYYGALPPPIMLEANVDSIGCRPNVEYSEDPDVDNMALGEVAWASAEKENREGWGIWDAFTMGARSIFFFTDEDWKRLVVEGADDALLRSESSKKNFVMWKHQFSSYDMHKNHTYDLFNGSAHKGYIYLIEDENAGLTKIGFTSNGDVEKRRSSLQTGNASLIRTKGSFPCAARSTEKALHEIFGEKRVTGEWFALSSDDVGNVLDPHWRSRKHIY
jgi:hypothetical protein